MATSKRMMSMAAQKRADITAKAAATRKANAAKKVAHATSAAVGAANKGYKEKMAYARAASTAAKEATNIPASNKVWPSSAGAAPGSVPPVGAEVAEATGGLFSRTKAGASELMSLLGKGNLKMAARKFPGTMSTGGLILLSLLTNKLMGHRQVMEGEELQQQALETQMNMSPDDKYYQAMMPELVQERQGAQNALMQAILGSRGQVMQVPGERMIGG